MKFDPIAKDVSEVLTQLTTELLAYDLQNRIENSQENTQNNNNGLSEDFYELQGEPNSIKFNLVKCSVTKDQINLSGDITFTEFDTATGRKIHTFKCKEASLRIQENRLEPEIVMDLQSATDIDTGEIKMWHFAAGMKIPNNIQKILSQFNNEQGSVNVQKLSSQVAGVPGFKPGPELVTLQNKLEREILITKSELKSEIHSRLVFGIGCIAMILIGIALGIIKRGGHLLSAFGAPKISAHKPFRE